MRMLACKVAAYIDRTASIWSLNAAYAFLMAHT